MKNDKKGSDTSRTKIDHQDRSIHLSRNAKQRLKWIEHFNKYRNARLTCRHFCISPDTFYLWKKRFDVNNLLSLEDDKKTRKPGHVRQPKYTAYQIEAIKKLKDVNPKIGKTLISRILKEANIPLSPSTVTRILKQLQRD